MNDILVTNERGETLHTTYQRRARGLVKKGRAYYVDDSTICLLCPPISIKENIMETITMNDILTRIDALIQNTDYMKEAFMTFEKMPHDLNEETTTIRSKAIMDIVEAREKTNRELIALLDKMYEDIPTANTAVAEEV